MAPRRPATRLPRVATLAPPRAISSAGRAPPRQGGGHWFEPSIAHLEAPLRWGLAFSGSHRLPFPPQRKQLWLRRESQPGEQAVAVEVHIGLIDQSAGARQPRDAVDCERSLDSGHLVVPEERRCGGVRENPDDVESEARRGIEPVACDRLDLGAPPDRPWLAQILRPMLDVDEESVLGEQPGEL